MEYIFELDYVQPDFLLFHNNMYLESFNKLRTAGIPDLALIYKPSNRLQIVTGSILSDVGINSIDDTSVLSYNRNKHDRGSFYDKN